MMEDMTTFYSPIDLNYAGLHNVVLAESGGESPTPTDGFITYNKGDGIHAPTWWDGTIWRTVVSREEIQYLGYNFYPNRVYFVSPNFTDANNHYNTIEKAIDNSNDGDTIIIYPDYAHTSDYLTYTLIDLRHYYLHSNTHIANISVDMESYGSDRFGIYGDGIIDNLALTDGIAYINASAIGDVNFSSGLYNANIKKIGGYLTIGEACSVDLVSDFINYLQCDTGISNYRHRIKVGLLGDVDIISGIITIEFDEIFPSATNPVSVSGSNASYYGYLTLKHGKIDMGAYAGANSYPVYIEKYGRCELQHVKIINQDTHSQYPGIYIYNNSSIITTKCKVDNCSIIASPAIDANQNLTTVEQFGSVSSTNASVRILMTIDALNVNTNIW